MAGVGPTGFPHSLVRERWMPLSNHTRDFFATRHYRPFIRVTNDRIESAENPSICRITVASRV